MGAKKLFRSIGIALAETQATFEQASKLAEEFANVHYKPGGTGRNWKPWATKNIMLAYNDQTTYLDIIAGKAVLK
jgi:hypothetical protein